jgi:hypothetical protein
LLSANRAALLLITGLLHSGCDDVAAGAAAAPIVRDSSGIQIVENSAYAWREGEEWTLSDSIHLDIGRLEGDPDYQLFRVSAAVRRSDGAVVVANSGSHEIRVFDRDGNFVSASGRAGEGPGEYRSLSSLWRIRGDSLMAWDEGLRRATVLTPMVPLSGTL